MLPRGQQEARRALAPHAPHRGRAAAWRARGGRAPAAAALAVQGLAGRLPWPDLAALAVFAGAATILLFPALTHGALRWQDDTKYFYFPLLSRLDAALHQGRLPLWEPGIFGGYPLFADGESGMLYPLHLLVLPWMAPASALVVLRLLRFFFAGAFSYAFLRALGAGRTGATVSGLVFMLSGFMVGQVVHENLDDGMIWLPLALCFAERAVRAPAPRRYGAAAMAGVALGVQALALHVQVVVFSALVVFPYLGWRVLFPDTIKARLPGRLLIGLGLGLVTGLVEAGLAAVQMLPLLDLADRSARGHGIGLGAATINSVTPFQLLTVVFPHLLKRPDGLALTYWVEWEVAIYVGVPALLLAAVAVALRRDRYTLFFGVVAVAALVLSTGRYGPRWVVLVTEDLLGEHGLRSPGRFAFLWSAAAAVLAGLGVDWLERQQGWQRTGSVPARRRLGGQLWLAAVGAALAGLCGALLLAVRAAYQWVAAHPQQTRAWLEAHYVAFDRTARLRATAEDVYSGLVAALDPRNPATVVWALSVAGGYGLLVAWCIAGRWARLRRALRALTLLVVAVPLLAAGSQAHPEAVVAAIEPDSGAALYLRDQLAPPGVPEAQRPLYRVYTGQPLYLGHTDVEPNVLLPLGIQEAGGYSSLSSTVNLAYGWAAETSQGPLFDVWNARYVLWPNQPNPLPSYELTSFHPQRPLLSGSGANAGATGSNASFRVPGTLGENVRVVATLRDAWQVPHGTVVAWVTATDDQGQGQRWPLRAGMEVAEATAPPGPPAPPAPATASDGDTSGAPPAEAAEPVSWPLPVFSWKEFGADGSTSTAWLYYAKLPLDTPRHIVRLRVEAVRLPQAPIAIFRLYGLGVGQPDWQVQNVTWWDRERFSLAYQDSEVRVYRNASALPRAYLVPLAVTAPGALHLKEMAERGFDPTRMLLLDAGGQSGALEGPSEPLGTGSWVAASEAAGWTPAVQAAGALGRVSVSPAGRVTLTRAAGEQVAAEVEAANAGWLFLADTYDPNWRAFVDGAPRPIRLANAMFRAVAVPAGRHTVVFRYQPAPLQRGAAITLATGLAVLAALAGLLLSAARRTSLYSGRAR